MSELDKPIVNLDCACCGALVRGRQWHNRDTGYGFGVECFEYVSQRMTPEEIEDCYGIRGIHWDVQETRK